MTSLLVEVLRESVQVTLFVFLMMVAVDLVNVWKKGRISALMRHGRRWRRYVVSSFLGATPGCIGAFTDVSMYMHGMISVGALVGSMAATSGDEAFVMLAMFPETALLLFALLFILGIGLGWLADRVVEKWNIPTCQDCDVSLVHPNEGGIAHYLREHVWRHIMRRHLWRTFLWTLGALLAVKVGIAEWKIDEFAGQYTLALLLFGALVGLIPESGPHLLFVSLYASGVVPFSVLFASSVVQDGHGLLPLLSNSVQDSLLIKAFNFVVGLSLGLILYAFGI